MNESLWQYCVLKHPTPEQRKNGGRTEIVLPVSDWVLAENEREVVMIATRRIPEEHMEDAGRLEVGVRPF